MSDALIHARDLCRYYRVGRGLWQEPATVRALDGVSFQLERGRTLAVVGESGCGKSTLARQITLIETPSSGELVLDGVDLANASREAIQATRRKVQIVFQDPFGSLNPRKKVGTIIEEPLAINTRLSRAERREKCLWMMDKVGLRPEHYGRYPHMFSGGQRQRIAIARALVMQPMLAVADEPVSALDVSIQAQVLNLLMDLQEEFNLAYLFISHDLSVVEHIADEVMVMYLGRVVEQGSAETIFARPRHPYTQALLASTPQIDPAKRRQRVVLKGELPTPLNPPAGCAFHTRCPHARAACAEERPMQRDYDGRQIACLRVEELGDDIA
ncbi:MAG: peptide ABC transporter ATP-binding protein [Gammaproteobacteria bacterium]